MTIKNILVGLVATLIMLAYLGASFLITAGLTWVVTWGLEYVFTWKLAVGIWGIILMFRWAVIGLSKRVGGLNEN